MSRLPMGLRGIAITDRSSLGAGPALAFLPLPARRSCCACHYHRVNWLFAGLDIQSFFDSVTRTKVHRALKRIRIPQEEAVEITRVSALSKA